MYVSASAYISSSSLAPGCMKITPLVIRNKDRKSTRLNSSHSQISYAVFCLKKKKTTSVLPYFSIKQSRLSLLFFFPVPLLPTSSHTPTLITSNNLPSTSTNSPTSSCIPLTC